MFSEPAMKWNESELLLHLGKYIMHYNMHFSNIHFMSCMFNVIYFFLHHWEKIKDKG